jgi:transposase-like protein
VVEANSAPDGGRWWQMLGHGAKFDHKKEQAIAALLSHRNVEAAARAVGISSNTLLRWTKEAESMPRTRRRGARRPATRSHGCKMLRALP